MLCFGSGGIDALVPLTASPAPHTSRKSKNWILRETPAVAKSLFSKSNSMEDTIEALGDVLSKSTCVSSPTTRRRFFEANRETVSENLSKSTLREYASVSSTAAVCVVLFPLKPGAADPLVSEYSRCISPKWVTIFVRFSCDTYTASKHCFATTGSRASSVCCPTGHDCCAADSFATSGDDVLARAEDPLPRGTPTAGNWSAEDALPFRNSSSDPKLVWRVGPTPRIISIELRLLAVCALPSVETRV
mmetsp:Transcript_11704/g.38915  ORF Transcript_11704/g.38915 Transcript_11704/m.38915 type:complete len:247 (+) Transcript_11704:1048-1788(+)